MPGEKNISLWIHVHIPLPRSWSCCSCSSLGICQAQQTPCCLACAGCWQPEMEGWEPRCPGHGTLLSRGAEVRAHTRFMDPVTHQRTTEEFRGLLNSFVPPHPKNPKPKPQNLKKRLESTSFSGDGCLKLHRAALWDGAPLELLAAPVILAGCSGFAVYLFRPADEHCLGQGVWVRPGSRSSPPSETLAADSAM